VVWTGHFEKFSKMVHLLLRLALEFVLNGRDILLTRVIGFLIITVVSSRHNDALGVPLLPLPTTLGAFPSTLDGGFGWCCSAIASNYFCIAQDEGDPNCLLTRGVSGGDMK
jgi:hypothetical protein